MNEEVSRDMTGKAEGSDGMNEGVYFRDGVMHI